jgi:hypothetical protein
LPKTIISTNPKIPIAKWRYEKRPDDFIFSEAILKTYPPSAMPAMKLPTVRARADELPIIDEKNQNQTT